MKKLLAIAVFGMLGAGTVYAGDALNALKAGASLPEVTPVLSATVDRAGLNREACEDSALEAIEVLSNGIADGISASMSSEEAASTINVASDIFAIARSCKSTKVKESAIVVAGAGIDYSKAEPTTSIARMMESVCGSDRLCAHAAVHVLGLGISYRTVPTISVAESIVKIVKQAPGEEVKKRAFEVLSHGISVNHTHPTQEVSAAMAELANCADAK